MPRLKLPNIEHVVAIDPHAEEPCGTRFKGPHQELAAAVKRTLKRHTRSARP